VPEARGMSARHYNPQYLKADKTLTVNPFDIAPISA
jgi:hypothetical protein